MKKHLISYRSEIHIENQKYQKTKRTHKLLNYFISTNTIQRQTVNPIQETKSKYTKNKNLSAKHLTYTM